jgi:glycosyltransferase involved in cell wall biosynthesis
MDVPSHYQGDLFRTLASRGDIDLRVVYARTMPGHRRDLGWSDNLVGYRYQFLNQAHRVNSALRVAWEQRSRIHIVDGLWVEPAFSAALLVLALARSTFAVYSEGQDPGIVRGAGKKALQTVFGRIIARQAAGALAVARSGRAFCRRLGFVDARTYSFGYFRAPAKQYRPRPPAAVEGPVEVVFVGQLTGRKGVDLLVEAMSPLFAKCPQLRLTIVGDGDLLPRLKRRVSDLDLVQYVRFEGVIPSEEIPMRIASTDVLVLPSRYDGWGIVVNEALASGVPVLVSDSCGAAELIQNAVNGYVFKHGSVEELRNCLSHFLESRSHWDRLREGALATSTLIAPQAIAPYLVGLLRHMTGLSDQRPDPPWACLADADPRADERLGAT